MAPGSITRHNTDSTSSHDDTSSHACTCLELTALCLATGCAPRFLQLTAREDSAWFGVRSPLQWKKRVGSGMHAHVARASRLSVDGCGTKAAGWEFVCLLGCPLASHQAHFSAWCWPCGGRASVLESTAA
eukprot:6468799-Amphidinium_carterae.1